MSDTELKLSHFRPETFQLLPHMFPHIRISPFLAQEWSHLMNAPQNFSSPVAEDAAFWLDDASDLLFCNSGRNALLACLKHLQLKLTDEVLIVTTTQGPYISSCVTKTIEKVCKWSRSLSDQTRLVLVIHEFGFPCPCEHFEDFAKQGLPVLEDCAYALGSRQEKAAVGIYGDFAIYSFMKHYPIPFGGLFVSKEKINEHGSAYEATANETDLMKQTVDQAAALCSEWNQQRRDNWAFFAEHLPADQFQPYFELPEKIVPGVYLTKVPEGFAGEAVKKRLNTAGVESTQYYNQGGFYFPVHQFLTDYEKQYILYYFLGTK